MAVVTSRQAGARPETIRTRLARFMPTRSAGWTITWAAKTERPADIHDEDQLRAAEHVGCYGAAVAHALAQANIAATRLSVSAQAPASLDDTPQPIVVEVRALIPSAQLDQSHLEMVLRRVEAPCATWKALAAEVGIRVSGVLEDPTTAESDTAQTETSAQTARPQPSTTSQSSRAQRLAMPQWLTFRFGALLVAALGGLAVLTHH